jgi:hypothetical protein
LRFLQEHVARGGLCLKDQRDSLQTIEDTPQRPMM